LKDEHWDEILICNEDEKLGSKQQDKQNASKFFSFFHITDFISILSGQQVAFVDPYERFTHDAERSYIAYFDLKRDINTNDDSVQFKQLEKLFNQTTLSKTRFFNGTIIRLPLRTQVAPTSPTNTSITNKCVFVKDLLVNAKDFMKEAHLHILFAKNISSIHFCRTKDGQNTEIVSGA
jgi:hypothetical protein